jgi:hypothetical protein
MVRIDAHRNARFGNLSAKYLTNDCRLLLAT